MRDMDTDKSEIIIHDETETGTDSRIYEVGYHLLPTVSAEDAPGEAAKIKEAIASFGGSVISEDEPKMMPLAYPIEKVIENKHARFESAHFGWVKFEAGSNTPSELKKFLEKNEMILRFLIIKTVRENTLARKPIVFDSEKRDGESERENARTHHGYGHGRHDRTMGVASSVSGSAPEKISGAPEAVAPVIDEAALDKQIDELVIS